MTKQGMRDAECSVFIGNIDPRVSEEVLWELFLQVDHFYFVCFRIYHIKIGDFTSIKGH